MFKKTDPAPPLVPAVAPRVETTIEPQPIETRITTTAAIAEFRVEARLEDGALPEFGRIALHTKYETLGVDPADLSDVIATLVTFQDALNEQLDGADD